MVKSSKELCSALQEMQEEMLQHFFEIQTDYNHRELSSVSHFSESDYIYQIDTHIETAIFQWFEKKWPANEPIQLVMEGLDPHHPTTFPRGTPVEETYWKCIIDPIDGTRCIMYDMRSAWILSALAPQKGKNTSLKDIHIAVMTELPVRKQFLSDQVSAIRSKGFNARRYHRFEKTWTPIELNPYQGNDLAHGFSGIVNTLPEASRRLGEINEQFYKDFNLWSAQAPVVFHDQYICTGGQFYEMLRGNLRFMADLRLASLEKEGAKDIFSCHAYDICTLLILEEAGCILTDVDGTPLKALLNETATVNWIAYANKKLKDKIEPVLNSILCKHG